MRLLPIGVTDFAQMRENHYYYVDKTKWIEELLEDGAKVKLFTRPRRFGKTLNMSMLEAFFDLRKSEKNKELFTDLYIFRSPFMKEQGKYPLIFLSLKDFKSQTWEECLSDIKAFLQNIFYQYRYLLEELDSFARERFSKFISGMDDIAHLKHSLKFLTEALYEIYQREVVLLIDEYDTPLLTAYEYGYYEEAMSFFRTLYSSALKDNEYLKMGVMTGILHVAKEGIFSGLNNLSSYGVLEEKYASYFGLEEEEVRQALEYYEMSYHMGEVKEWYDGYRFGKMDIYNPWSIVNYISHKKLGAYWVNTSNNFLIYDLLEQSHRDLSEELRRVFQGKSIEKTLDSTFHFQNVRNARSAQEVWSLLVHSGYLTIEKELDLQRYTLKIPNQEIYSFFEKSFLNRFLGGVDIFQETMQALRNRNFKLFSKKLQDILLTSLSYHDLGKEEKAYHNLMLGMTLSLSQEYELTSNQESGYGRYDLLLKPKKKGKPAYIFEFKMAKKVEDLEKRAKEAFEQIEEKCYDFVLKKRAISPIVKLGIAFCGKYVAVYTEE